MCLKPSFVTFVKMTLKWKRILSSESKISGLENDLHLAKTSQVNLTEMNELVLAKLALANKDIKLYEITSGATSHVPKLSAKPPSISQPLVIASSSSREPTIKKPLANIPAKPFLIAKVRDSVTVSSIPESKIDSLLGLDDDKGGPVVQQLKRHNDKSVKLIFRDETNRDKARELLDRPEAEKVFSKRPCSRKELPSYSQA